MSGAVITGARTTIGVDSGSTLSASQVKVYPTGGTADADVVVDLFRQPSPVEDIDGTRTPIRMGAAGLTRDEAFNLIRGIQRALGINPDRLVTALRGVEGSGDDLPTEELFLAFDELYGAVAEALGEKTADQR